MNNIPAFPLYAQEQTTGHLSFQEGMTLLDYFAGQALVGLCSDLSRTNYTDLGAKSYDIAKLVMDARKL